MNSYQTLYSKWSIDEPLKAIQVIDFLFFFFFSSWINRHHSRWLLAYLPVTAFKAAAEGDASYFLPTLFMFPDSLQVLKSLLMSGRVESGVLDEGDSAGVAYITYCMHAHSFKAAIIAFLVTHALTDGITLTLHAHSFFGCLIWNDTQATVRAGIFVLKSARYEHSIFPTLVWLAPGAEAMLERASETSPVWCGHKDVLHLHKRNPFQEKRDEGSSCEWGGQP